MDQPLYVEFNVERRRVRVVYQTQPSFEQWKATMEAVLDDPRFKTGFGILLDRSRIIEPATPEYMRLLVDFVDQHSQEPEVRWAIVTSDLGSFGMGRLAQRLAQRGNIRTFTDRSDAEAWVGGQCGSPT